MKYLLTINYDESDWPPAARVADAEEYWRLHAATRKAGAFIDSNALEPSSASVCVRVRDGEGIVTDGPFAETKEQLGGYYLLECASADEAAQWAAKIPAARHGYVEVRPVIEFEAPEWFAAEFAAEAP